MKLLRPFRWLLIALAVAMIPAASRAEVIISVGFGPPPLLVYEQPPCPEPGLIWMPGYWAYGDDGYYWVPGAWVPAPYVGALWTPGYWGWDDGMYYWHPGYWGPHVGYYGGINYGFGYFGVGFLGGRWNGGFFEYNTAVWRVNTVIIHRTYVDRDWDRHYVDRDHDRRVAFNGGPGGIRHDPDRHEREYMREPHVERTSFQTQHIEAARSDRNAYYNVNRGRPDRIVSARPLAQENRPAPVPQRNGFNNNPRNMNNGPRGGYQEQPNRGGNNPLYDQHNNQRGRQEQPQQPQYRTQPEYRPAQPQGRPQQPEYRQAPPQQQPQQPEYRPQQQPQYRQPQENRPQPEYRPAQPQGRPQQPEYRQPPPQQPQYRQQQPEYRPQPQRQPEYRQPPQSRPEPQGRPEPQQRPENHGNGGDRQQQEHGHGR